MQTQSLYTYRPLVYRRRDSMAEFFEESPLWKALYKRLFLPLKKSQGIKCSAKAVFNEACALMALAQTDSTRPEELDEFESRVKGIRYRLTEGSDKLCWALIYALTDRDRGSRRRCLLHGLARKNLNALLPDVSVLLPFIEGFYDAVTDSCSANPSLEEANARLTEENKQLTEANARLKDENARLAARVAQLEQQLAEREQQLAEREQQLAERDNVQRLPLSDFLTHVEQLFTHEQNPSALIVKDVLFALYTNPTAEERSRLNKLGHLPPPPPFGSITVQGPLNDIHGNEHVKAGL